MSEAFWRAEQMDGDEVTTTTETVYTAYALTLRGREEIECYGTVEEAVLDMLETFNEDDDDIIVVDNLDRNVVFMAHDANDSTIAHVYFIRHDCTSLDHCESYRCTYATPAMGGAIRTVIERLA